MRHGLRAAEANGCPDASGGARHAPDGHERRCAGFVATVGLSLWPIIAGLVLGGVLAAPFAALVARRLPDRPLMVIVGVVVCLVALRGLLASLRALAGGG